MECTGCVDLYKCSGQKDARYMVLDVQLTEEQYRSVMAKL
jgi:hypothetical protein